MQRVLPWMLWIGAFLIIGQIFYFVLRSSQPVRHDEGTPLTTSALVIPVKEISAIVSGHHGILWVGTVSEGLVRYDFATKKTEQFSTQHGLPENRITALALDWQDRLWIGTARHGIVVLQGTTFKNYDFGFGPTGEHIFAIKIAPDDGAVWIATNHGLTRYDPEAEAWSQYTTLDGLPENQIRDLAFDNQGHLFVGTLCHGIAILAKNGEDSRYQFQSHVFAPQRFGSQEAPNVSPVPLHAVGTGLPSNRINALLGTQDGTVWAATDTGLAWSRDQGQSWFFLRGRDYGEKMRGLLAGTPQNWTEIPRKRFGELLPEDAILSLAEDAKGTLWIGTQSLGCINILPQAFYQELQADSRENQSKFLESMAVASRRFFNKSAGEIVAMAPWEHSEILIATRDGTLEQTQSLLAETTLAKAGTNSKKSETFPQRTGPLSEEMLQNLLPKNLSYAGSVSFPYAVFDRDDWKTAGNWFGFYGNDYVLLGGADGGFDRLVAPDESSCRVRIFSGDAGHRTRPVERIELEKGTLDPAFTRLTPGQERIATLWRCLGNAVPKSCDGPHLWCSVELESKRFYRLNLYFVETAPFLHEQEKRIRPIHDHEISIYPRPVDWKTDVDWTELGKQADLWAAKTPPLTKSRVLQAEGGVHKQFVLAGQGAYLVKIDKNFGTNVELVGVMLDCLNPEIPEEDQWVTFPAIPEAGPEAIRNLWKASDYQVEQMFDLSNHFLLRSFAYQAAASLQTDPDLQSLAEVLAWRLMQWPNAQKQKWNELIESLVESESIEQTADIIVE